MPFFSLDEMAIFSKFLKPDSFESHNSLKPSFTNIEGLPYDFSGWESFIESNYPGILVLCQTNLEDSTDYSNLPVRSYLPITQKDSATDMHGLAVYLKEKLPLAWDLSLENSEDSHVFDWLYFIWCLTFFICQSPSSSLSTFFDTI